MVMIDMERKNLLNHDANETLNKFRTESYATDAQVQQIKQAINTSPFLAETINTSVDKQMIASFQFLSHEEIAKNQNTQGYYNHKKEIKINPDLLNHEGDLVFTLAHETQHSLDNMKDFYNSANKKLEEQAKQRGFRNYTDEVVEHIKSLREKEARAEITGFNAVVDRLKQMKKPVTADEMYWEAANTIKYFIEKNGKSITFKSNLEFNQDKFLDMNEKNIQAMGQNFFHSPDTKYPNSYAASYILEAIKSEHRHNSTNSKVNLDMTELAKYGITEEGLKEKGVDFKYINKIESKNKDKTSSIENSTPSIYAENRIQTIKEISENTVLSARTQKLIQQCDEQFTALCERRGITADHPQEMENVKMAAVFAALSKDMTKIDKMDFGENRTLHLLSYEPHGILASVSTDEAVNIHVSESLGKVQHLEQHMAQQAQERQIAQSQQQSKGLYIG